MYEINVYNSKTYLAKDKGERDIMANKLYFLGYKFEISKVDNT